ncbi:zinc finger protein ubi-d4 isoform X1 [Ctenocephalides felis]|uniref:zinc finger protein ubi-d4 isoform X1 n=1 Tax=Ctenocephalides felis TaxID=7515 RepID=UPI000E6E1DEC|nr:zinc finger protein ubi-d4 isoform X1 [Ctenocephalides felis]
MAVVGVQLNPVNNLPKIESFLNDSSYKEAIESSSNFNTRLCVERRLRMPFLDPQTGVAQNPCALFMKKKQRMPGMREGQIYTYPSARWRKARRQYLRHHQPYTDIIEHESDIHTVINPEQQVTGPSETEVPETSQSHLKDEPPSEWFYDELELHELEALEDPDPDSDYDYEESYSKRRKKRGNAKGRSSTANSENPPAKRGRSGAGRGGGRRKTQPPAPPPPYEVMVEGDKPYGCELCGAKYKTRPGLVYHYGHIHKENASDGDSRDSSGKPPPAATANSPVNSEGSNSTSNSAQPQPQTQQQQSAAKTAEKIDPKAPATEYQDSYVTFLNSPTSAAPAGTPKGRSRSNLPANSPVVHLPATILPEDPPMPVLTPEPKTTEIKDVENPSTPVNKPGPAEKGKAAPSPYCDFCLGDQRENKKTGTAEELVSCSDCGRSGHPSCLQFTANMIVSVRKYRWQCIECKCCSLCGTSDNDDQLLFCDDCDRGYHMYCLKPPLATPPEGSWSCHLCLTEFHK